MQIGRGSGAVTGIRFVIAAAGTNRPRPAGLAIGFVCDVMRVEELLLLFPADAVVHGAEAMRVRPGEAMAQRDVAVRRNAHQSDAGAARIGLRVPLVDL